MTKVNGKVTCDKCGDQVGRHDEIEESITEKTNENMKDKVNNLLKFTDFEKNWKEDEAKPTKRTEVAKDVIKEKFYNTDELDTDDDFEDDNAENSGLYDDMGDLLNQANTLVCNYKGEDSDEYEISSPDEAIDLLNEIEEDHELYSQAQELIDNIAALNDDIDSIEAKEYFDEEDEDEDEFESVKTFDKFSITEKKDKCCKECGLVL